MLPLLVPITTLISGRVDAGLPSASGLPAGAGTGLAAATMTNTGARTVESRRYAHSSSSLPSHSGMFESGAFLFVFVVL